MVTVVRRLGKTLGRRGVALAILGVAKICFGLGYALSPGPKPVGLKLLTDQASIQCWSAVWIVFGMITFCCAWLRIGRDVLGFIAALIPPFIWGFAFLWGAVSGEYPRGLAIAAWYAFGHVGFILWAATVPDFSVPHYPRKEEK